MYITKYGCVFLKLGESIYRYVAMDFIPILLGSLPLADNARHSLVILDHYVVLGGQLVLEPHVRDPGGQLYSPRITCPGGQF